MSVKVVSDWSGVEPEKHRGVKYGQTTTFYFAVEGYKIGADGAADYDQPLAPRFYALTSNSANASVILNLPVEKSLRYVWIKQVRKLGCVGNDSLTIRSQNGWIQIQSDTRSKNYVFEPSPVASVTIRCSSYEGPALVASSNLSASRMSPRKRIIAEDGRVVRTVEH